MPIRPVFGSSRLRGTRLAVDVVGGDGREGNGWRSDGADLGRALERISASKGIQRWNAQTRLSFPAREGRRGGDGRGDCWVKGRGGLCLRCAGQTETGWGGADAFERDRGLGRRERVFGFQGGRVHATLSSAVESKCLHFGQLTRSEWTLV